MENEKIFRTTLEQLSDSFVALDKEFRFTYANKK